MIVAVDSSVWIDFLRGTPTLQVEHLDRILNYDLVVVPDLVLTEVLQGCRSSREFDRARSHFAAFKVIELCGEDLALRAALNYRRLRALGVTVRKTIDTIVATKCIDSGYRLLYADRDFEPFVTHLGLRPAIEARPS